MLRSQECFGQYGRIVKAVVNKSHLSTDRNNATASAYITFANKADAQNCIDLIDGYILDGSLLRYVDDTPYSQEYAYIWYRASFGTTKYCNFFLRNLVCNNPECLYLHELGETDDSFTKEEMATGTSYARQTHRIAYPGPVDFVAGKGCFRDLTGYDDRRGTAFPTLAMLQPGGALDKVAPTDAQRKAQSAAAIYKLRSQTPDERKSPTRAPSSSSSSMSPKDEQTATKHRAPPSTSDAPPSASPLSASSASSSSSASPAKDASKPALYVNTHPPQSSPQPDATPLWSQPFPRMQPPPEQPSRPIQHVFSPFGMGFEGGIHRNTVQPPPEPAPAPSSNHVSAWTFDAPPPRPDAPFEFSAVDAAFTPRNESSEALAGLLGVKLSAKPLVPQGIGPGPNGRASRFSFANKDGPGEYSPFGFESQAPPPTPFGFAHHQPPPPPAEYLHMAPAGDASGLAFLQQMLPNVNISYGSDPHRFPEPNMGGGTAWNQDLRPQESTPFWSSQGAFESASGFAAGFQDPAIVNQGAPYGAGPGFYHHRDEHEQSKMQFAYRG